VVVRDNDWHKSGERESPDLRLSLLLFFKEAEQRSTDLYIASDVIFSH